MSKFKLSAVCAMAFGAAMLAGGSARAANLVSDGDFSSPYVGSSWSMFSNGQVGTWNNTNNPTDTIEVGNSGVYGLACINASCTNLEVNANNFDTVAQLVTGLQANQSYIVSWEYGGRTSGGPDYLNVSFGGATLTQDSGSIGQWTGNSFKITATGASELLQFASVTTDGLPSYGNEITNVSVTAVPEPATWGMMLLGLLGMGAVLRRGRKPSAAAALA